MEYFFLGQQPRMGCSSFFISAFRINWLNANQKWYCVVFKAIRLYMQLSLLWKKTLSLCLANHWNAKITHFFRVTVQKKVFILLGPWLKSLAIHETWPHCRNISLSFLGTVYWHIHKNITYTSGEIETKFHYRY